MKKVGISIIFIRIVVFMLCFTTVFGISINWTVLESGAREPSLRFGIDSVWAGPLSPENAVTFATGLSRKNRCQARQLDSY